MSLIFRILLAAAVHAAFFACYPDTGPNGRIYLAVSLLAWAGFLITLSSGLKLFRMVSNLFGLLFNLAFFALMTAALGLTMPQEDRVTVLEKIRDKKQYPTLDTARIGLKRLNGYYREAADTGPGKEIRKAAEKLNK